jgi:hypothetical protein
LAKAMGIKKHEAIRAPIFKMRVEKLFVVIGSSKKFNSR